MARKHNRVINLPAPYLRRVWLERARVKDAAAYPFCLPFLAKDFELGFDRAITIIVGENGTGKSTLLEGIAALAGYDEAGGGKGYMPVDHSRAIEVMGGTLSQALARELAAEDHQWLVLPRRELLLGGALSGLDGEGVRRRRRPTSSPTPMARGSCASSRSAASARASSSSTSRNPRCRRRGRSSS